MERKFYLDLAAAGLRMPIGAHLVLHEHADPDAIVLTGERLGQVMVETARRFRTPLAVALMDLTVEKTALLEMFDVPAEQIPTFHFDRCPDDGLFARLAERMTTHRSPRVEANCGALAHVARHADLLPIGMAIGPFSLMVKLVRDPIAAVFMAGRGVTAEQNPQVATVERTLELATRVVEWSLRKQIAAGARAMLICEPAASNAYISPRQMAAGADTFDRYVMRFNRRVKDLLDESGVDLVFHCCGEITDEILSKFVTLDPAILSLGGSRTLWEDAAFVPKTTVLFGNLPSKKFFSDAEITRAQVQEQARELITRMREVGHPFILGTECDVLSVDGCHDVILDKVAAFLDTPGD
jgi:uroporphyrinogen-III decarboxylase